MVLVDRYITSNYSSVLGEKLAFSINRTVVEKMIINGKKQKYERFIYG